MVLANATTENLPVRRLVHAVHVAGSTRLHVPVVLPYSHASISYNQPSGRPAPPGTWYVRGPKVRGLPVLLSRDRALLTWHLETHRSVGRSPQVRSDCLLSCRTLSTNCDCHARHQRTSDSGSQGAQDPESGDLYKVYPRVRIAYLKTIQ